MGSKEQYLDKLQARLNGWIAEVARLRAQAEKSEAEARLALQQIATDLEQKIEDARQNIAQLDQASDEAWESIRDGFESAWDTLAHAFSEAAKKIGR